MSDFYEIDFLPIGDNSKSGDAILVRVQRESGYSYINLVDGGYTDDHKKITKALKEYYDSYEIDNLICTHPDNDHAAGLCGVIENAVVKAVFINRPWLYKKELVGMFKDGRMTEESLERTLREKYPYADKIEKLANDRGIPLYECFQGLKIGDFTVCAPSKSRYLECVLNSDKTPDTKDGGILKSAYEAIVDKITIFSELWNRDNLREDVKTTFENEMSIVQFAHMFDKRKILLTGDAGKEDLEEAVNYLEENMFIYEGDRLDFMQAPHHGGRGNITPSLLDRLLGKILDEGDETKKGSVFISAAKDDPDHPKLCVQNAFLRRGFFVGKTEGKQIRYSSKGAPAREGWSPLTPIPFAQESEPWDD